MKYKLNCKVLWCAYLLIRAKFYCSHSCYKNGKRRKECKKKERKEHCCGKHKQSRLAEREEWGGGAIISYWILDWLWEYGLRTASWTRTMERFCRTVLNHQRFNFNHLNTELNPICHLRALLGAHHILHVSRIKVKEPSCARAHW